jgi:hypothetical protein
MTSARHGHSATLLSTTILNNGQLHVAGGWNGSAVLAARSWNRFDHLDAHHAPARGSECQTDTLISSGIRLLIAGVNAAVIPVSTAYL